jgi:putative SOS response-associated peptidase YedK
MSALRQKRPVTKDRPRYGRLTGHANEIGKVPLGVSCAVLGHARKVREGETTNEIFAFLTTEPNAEVGAIHPKAMPVILTTPDEVETWITAAPEEALKPQRPLPNGTLEILTRGLKEDPAEPSR